jgi:hypothetical protein
MRYLRRPAAVSAAVLSTLFAGCGSPGEPVAGDRVDRDTMRAVADDEGATADQVVRAGRAVDAASSGRTTLVTYTVHAGTSEGRSAAAWRLYDEGGDVIATEHAGVTNEGAASPHVVAVPDGYVVSETDGPVWHVSGDGNTERVSRTGRRPVRAGDVPLGFGSTRLYRPSDRTRSASSPPLSGNPQGWTVTEDGILWVQRPGRAGTVPFHRSTRAGTWEAAATYRPRRGHVVSGFALTAVGDHVVVPVVAEGRDLEKATLVGLLVRPSGAPADLRWRLLEAVDVVGDSWWDVRVAAVDATTVAVSTWGSPPYLVDVGEEVWEPVQAPTDEHGWTYEYERGRVYATHDDHADARVSTNRGDSWTRLPH